MIRLMGQRVHVTRALVRDDDGRKRRWTSEKCKPFDGWIVKFTWKCDGTVVPSVDSGPEWDWEPGYFRETKRTRCVEVREQPGSRAVLVPMDGFTTG